MRIARSLCVIVLVMIAAGCGTRGEQVRYDSGGVTLAGTLLHPDSEGPWPAVVLIHGSGNTDRNTMRYYAEFFVDLGYAALIYDKRGVGASGGSPDAWRRFSFDDLAADAAAGVTYLRGRDDVDAAHIGLFGASQGGWVAPLAALNAGNVDFMILISASLTTVADDRLFERAARLKREGFSESEIREASAMQRVDQELTRSGDGFDRFVQLWDEYEDTRWFRRVYEGDAPVGADDPWRVWYRTVLDVDPVPVIEELSIPTLCLFGDPALDRFGPVQASIERLEALKRAGKPCDYESYSGADHNLRNVDSGKEAPFKQRIATWLGTIGE